MDEFGHEYVIFGEPHLAAHLTAALVAVRSI